MKWLKSLFKKKEEEKLEIDTERLGQWFKEQTQIQLNDFKRELRDLFSSIEAKITPLKANIGLLEKAEIKDKIEERIKVVVTGNKEAYTRQVYLFLKQITVPVESSYKLALEYCSDFEKNLKNLNEKTAKNYHIIEQLLGEEIDKVTSTIKDIYKTVKEIKLALEKKEIVLMMGCKKKIKLLKERIELDKRAKNKIKENKIRKAEKEVFKKDIKQKKSILKKKKK